MALSEWGTRFAPLGPDGRQLAIEELPLVVAMREGHPVHLRFSVQSELGDERDLEVSAFPIVGNAGLRGGIAIFWESTD